MANPSADVVVIGAGHNGLVAACYLARAGLQVRVCEARSLVGGACVTEELIPGFQFSTCANAVWALDDKVVSDLSLVANGLVVDPLNPVRFQPFPDGNYLLTWSDVEATQAEIARVSPADAASWPRWVSFLQELGRLFGPLRYESNVDPLAVIGELGDGQDTALIRMLATESQDTITDEFFESAYMRAQIASYGPFNFSGGSGLGIIWASMLNGGSWGQGFARGGMGAITQSLEQTAISLGVHIETDKPVRRVVLGNRGVQGVETEDGQRINSRFVVSNVDPKRTFLQLIEAAALTDEFCKSVSDITTEPSCLKFHCTVSELPRYTAYDGEDPVLPSRAVVKLMPSREAFRQAEEDALAGKLPSHPAYSIFTPSIYDPSLSPRGYHTVSMYIAPVPYRLLGRGWDDRREEVSQLIVDTVTNYAPNFRRAVEKSILLTPLDLERRVLLTGGNIHHAEEIPGQLFNKRPAPGLTDYRTPIEGLYLCGAGCHPGGEVTGLPGHNAAHAILEDSR